MLWPLSEYRWRPLLNAIEEIAKMLLYSAPAQEMAKHNAKFG